jgi:hypothetical protein
MLYKPWNIILNEVDRADIKTWMDGTMSQHDLTTD